MAGLPQESGTRGLWSQAKQEALPTAAGSAVLPSCGCAGNSFPFVFPSEPHLLSNCPNSIQALGAPQPLVRHCLLGITPIPQNKGSPIWINPLTSAWRVRKLSRAVPWPPLLNPLLLLVFVELSYAAPPPNPHLHHHTDLVGSVEWLKLPP